MHTNKSNGKRYIGITSQVPEKRWMNGCGYSERLPIGRAIRKYGWDGFEHEILYSNATETFAKDAERKLIAQYKTQDDDYGYNITAGGDGVLGFHHTEESKQIMSEKKRGKNHPNYGKHLSEETKQKIGAIHKGNTYCVGLVRSDETKRKMSESKMKPVASYLDDGSFVKWYHSAREAAKELGINYKNISLCCNNQRKHAGGYCWQFA